MNTIARKFDGCLWVPNDIESFHFRDFIKKYAKKTVSYPEIMELIEKSPKIVPQIKARLNPSDPLIDKRFLDYLVVTPYEKGWYIYDDYGIVNMGAFVLPIKNLNTHTSKNFKSYLLQNFVCIGIFEFIDCLGDC